MAMIAVCMLAFSFPAEAQHIICCNSLIDVNGKWVGALRNCASELAKLNEPERNQACEKLKKAARFPGAVCDTAAPYYTACDQEAPERAKAEYRKWLEVYHSQRANADALNDEASRVAREGENFMAVGFSKEARALAAFQRVLAELARIEEIGGSPRARPKPSPR